MRHFLGGVPAVAGGGGGFDPLSITWAHAWWAEDPGWTNPGDGNAVSSWRNDGSQATAATSSGTNRPTFRSSYANLNSKPAVEFDGSNDYLDTSGAADMSQPNHVYIVGYASSSSGTPTVFDNGTVGSKRHLLRVRSGSTLQMFAGASVTAGTAIGPASFQVAALFNTTSSAIRANGQSATGLSVGSHVLGDPRLGASESVGTPFAGALAFVGVKDSALTTQELNDLDAWAVSHYGVPSL